MDLGLSRRTVLVTGSYRGTGAAIARVLAREGARLLVHGLEPGQAEPVAAGLREAGYDAAGVTGDIRCDRGAEALAEEVARSCDGVDVLVNNYGAAEGGGWSDDPTADWLHMFETNVLSGVRMVRHLVPGMKQRGWGRILFVSTVGSRRPRARMPGYYASKACLANVTVSLCKELQGTGITVNAISPGILATAEVRGMLERRALEAGWGTSWEEIQRHAAREFMPVPVGRLGDPEEVGALVAFLVSDWGGYINGADVRIDGGAADCV